MQGKESRPATSSMKKGTAPPPKMPISKKNDAVDTSQGESERDKDSGLLRPITLEDEDFIKNIKESSRGQIFEVTAAVLAQTQHEDDGDWDDMLTPS